MVKKLKNIPAFAAFALLVVGCWFLVAHAVAAELPEELRNAIQEKTKVLQEIDQKITETQKELETTEQKGKTLQQEIKQFDKSISQLGLSIKGGEIKIDKLKLEIEALQYDINITQGEIDLKKEAVARLLRQLQQKDSENTLAMLLKYKSLAASLTEAQNILDINSGLAVEVANLQTLNNALNDKFNATSNTKQKLELENKNLTYRKSIAQNQKSDKQSFLTQTKNQEKNYQNLISELEKQQQAISDEITKIEDQLRASFDPGLLPVKRPGVLAWPVKLKKDGGTAYITQHYGEKSYLYRGKPHNGLDIGGAPIGTPVFTADDGRVVAIDNNDRSSWQKYQYGKYVLIEHDNNLSTLYAHLSAQTVKVGDTVKRGDLIGYVGKTGYATGPHLHLGLYWTPSVLMKSIPPAAGLVPVGVTIDPEDYL